MNIKLRLAEEGELVEGGPTLEFVLGKEEVLLKEEEEEEEPTGRRQSRQQRFCTNERTEPCSADLSQTPSSNSGPDTNP